MLEAFFAGVCGAIALNVIWSYFARAERGLPVLEWVMLQLYVFFAMPVFFEGEATRADSFQALSRGGAILEALLATNLFVVCLLAGWWVLGKRNRKQTNATVRRVPVVAVFVYGLLSLAMSHLLARYEYEWQLEWFRSVLNLLFSPIIAQLLLLFELHHRPSDTRVAFLAWVFTGLMVVQGLFTGRLDYALTPLLTMGIATLASGHRIPRSLIVVVLAMLLIFNPAKLVYRQLTGYRTAEFGTLTLGQMTDAWFQSLQQIWGGGEKRRETAFDTTARRLNYLSINATVVDSVPDRVPYAAGEPWLAIPYSVVPRFLWPGKPNITEITNDRFNVLFGMTTWRVAARSTGAYPAVADGFWNLGWLGVAIAGFLAGLFWKTLFLIWTAHGRLRYVFAFLLLISARAASAFPALVIGVFQAAVACFVVVKVLEMLSSFGNAIRRGL